MAYYSTNKKTTSRIMLGMSDGLKEKILDIEKLYQSCLLLWIQGRTNLGEGILF